MQPVAGSKTTLAGLIDPGQSGLEILPILFWIYQSEAVEMQDPDTLRKLAYWLREFAERTGNPVIWEARLRTADELEAAADRIERDLSARLVDMDQSDLR